MTLFGFGRHFNI